MVTEINLLQLFFAVEPTKESSFVVIIGVSCGGFFVVALAGIRLIRSCQKRRSVRQKRCGSEVMPAEEAFSNREKYQLKSTKWKENIVCCDELGIWGKAIEGKTNETFY